MKHQHSSWYTPNIKRLISRSLLKKKSKNTAQPKDTKWIKFIKFRDTLRFFNKRNIVGSVSLVRDGSEVLKYPPIDDTTEKLIRRRKFAERAERRKRIRLAIMTVLRCLTCGIFPFISNFSCDCKRIFKRKRRIKSMGSREKYVSPKVALR